jgi:threonine/homoserine/homoserine lactone efflux protein
MLAMSFLAFVGVSLVVIITPGPDTALTIRNTLLGRRAGGVATAAGVAVGLCCWAVATSFGVVALLVASEPVFLAIKYVGAAYLVFLGVLALREALRRQPADRPIPAATDAPALKPVAAFRQGIISNLGNPKMAVFFASLLPQFVPTSQASVGAFLMLGSSFAVLTFTWLVLYAVVIARIGALLQRRHVRRWLEAVMGTLLVGFGLRLATERS